MHSVRHIITYIRTRYCTPVFSYGTRCTHRVDTFEFRVCDDCWLCSRWDEFKLAYTPGPSGPDGSRLYFACSAVGWRLREMTPHKNARCVTIRS